MKTVRFAMTSGSVSLVLALEGFAQVDAKLSAAEAVQRYPEIAKSGSAFKKAFLAKVAAAKAARDPALKKDDWPLVLATAVATRLGVQPEPSSPVGICKKKISEAIGSRWHDYLKQRNDRVTVGIVRASFFVTREGLIQEIRILENTSNEAFSEVCMRAIRDAKFPLPPPEAFAGEKYDRMAITFTFNLYPDAAPGPGTVDP